MIKSRTVLTATLLISLVGTGWHQASRKAASGTSQQPSDGIKQYYPLKELLFEAVGDVAGFEATPALALPVHCAKDGAAYLNMITPQTGAENVYVIRNRSGVKLDLNSVSGFDDFTVVDFFPSDSGVALLVRGVRSSSSSPLEDHKPRFYVMLPDNDGRLKDSSELPAFTTYSKVAVLPTGDYLLASFDEGNETQELGIYVSPGMKRKVIDQPMRVNERKGGLSGLLSSSQTQFISADSSILIWRMGTRDPVLQVLPSGVVREIGVALPQNESISDILSSDSNGKFIVHASVADSTGGSALNASATTYYEVSSLDGSILRRLATRNVQVGFISCEVNGSYVAFAIGANNRLRKFEAR